MRTPDVRSRSDLESFDFAIFSSFRKRDTVTHNTQQSNCVETMRSHPFLSSIVALLTFYCIHDSVAARMSPTQPLSQLASFSLHGEKESSSVRVTLVPRGGAFGRRLKQDPMGKAVLPHGKYSVGRMLEFHKAVWLPLALGLMVAFDSYTPRAGLMAGMFGGYGVLWVIKSYIFWDKQFYNAPDNQGGLGFVLTGAAFVSLYFLYPYLAVKNEEPLTVYETFLSSFLFVIGGFFHYAADAQKFFTLKYAGSGLITEGFFSRIRHPSYLGEYLMWLAMIVVAGYKKPLSWVPIAYLVTVSCLVTIPTKEKSLSRYPEYNEWKKQTGMLLPKLF